LDLHDVTYDWEYTVYGKVEEMVPMDIPIPLGQPVTLVHYKDANLYHYLITGCLMNKRPLDRCCKKKATVETATYGSEFVAAQIATDQIIDVRTTLQYLGFPIHHKSILFGDNQSVLTDDTLPHLALKKRHNALSYHHVWEAIAAKILGFFKVGGAKNPADILSKHNGFQQLGLW
jgi:hypothetical protein